MSNLNLKGIWIPIEILTDNKLSDKEKYIYAIILYLSKENNYCYLTNKSISELLNISITQVSKLVNSLKDKNYISIELIYKENSKQIEMRKLIPIVKNNDTYLTKVKYPLQQNFNTLPAKSLRIIKYIIKIIIKYTIKTNEILRKQKLILKKERMKDLILIHYMQIII